MRWMFAVVAVSLLPFAALAEEDAEGASDHPAVPRFPGFYISNYTVNDFNTYEFPTGDDQYATKEGRFWSIDYALKDGAKTPSAVELIRNYGNAFKKAGGKIVWTDNDTHATLMMPAGKSERWLHIALANANTLNTFTIVELAAMAQKVELTASDMLEALEKDGFVALHGILFDTGKDTIKPESEPLLAEIIKLLKDHAALRLSVEGHTDNVGDAKSNRTLSQKRAESVKKYLVGKGVAAKALETKGWGDTKPVADNRTEQGRASNRRVELVKK